MKLAHRLPIRFILNLHAKYFSKIEKSSKKICVSSYFTKNVYDKLPNMTNFLKEKKLSKRKTFLFSDFGT